MASPQTEKYARRQRRVEQGLVAASVLPRLPYSSIDGGNLKITNLNGDLVQVIGQQWDGSITSSPLGGTPPSAPTMPLLTPMPGGLNIYWDGTYVDDSPTRMDFKRVTFHAVTDVDDFDPLAPSQMCGEVTSATGGEVFASLLPVETYVFAVAWSEAGLFSVESDPAFGTPDGVVSGEVLQDLEDNLANLNDVELPALHDALDANASSIDNLNTTVLPTLSSDVDNALAQVAAAQAAAGDALDVANLASGKADAAEISALEKAWLTTNSTFNDWTAPAVAPAGYASYNSTPVIKNTANARTGRYAIEMATDNSTVAGVQIATAFNALPVGLEYVTVEVDVMLKAGSFNGAGVLFDWSGMTPSPIRDAIVLKDIIPSPVLNKMYRVTKTLQRPAGAAGTQSGYGGFLMANYTGNALGAYTSKTIVFDRVAARPASPEEISSVIAGGWRVTGKVTINGGAIEADSVDTAQLKAGSVVAATIAAGEVVAGKLAANAVVAANIKAGEVVAGKLGVDAVVATNIKAGEVTVGKLGVDAVVANNIKAGEVVAGKLSANAVLANNIKAGEVQAIHLTAEALTGKTLRTAVSGERLEINTDAFDASMLKFYSGLTEETNPSNIIADSIKVDANNIASGLGMYIPALTGVSGSASLVMRSGRGTVSGQAANVVELSSSRGTAASARAAVIAGSAGLIASDATAAGSSTARVTAATVELASMTNPVRIGPMAGISPTYSILAPIGEVVEYVGVGAAPTGWEYLDGQELPINTYPEVYALITTRFGTLTNGSGGAGTTHFRMPNAKGRVIVHQNSAETEFDSVGEQGGTKAVTLTAAQSGLREHYHQLTMSVGAAAGFTDGGNRASTSPDSNFRTGGVASGSGYGSALLGAQDASQSHTNLQPYMVLRYMMRMTA